MPAGGDFLDVLLLVIAAAALIVVLGGGAFQTWRRRAFAQLIDAFGLDLLLLLDGGNGFAQS